MTDKALKQYFNPHLLDATTGGSEHASRMLRVVSLESEDGVEYFNSLTRNEKLENKLEAIRAFQNLLKKITEISDTKLKNNVLWEFQLASKVRFETIALHDVEVVSKAMRAVIVDLVVATKNTGEEDIEHGRKNLVLSVSEKLLYGKDWLSEDEKDYFENRVKGLLKQILSQDDKLSDVICSTKVRQAIGLS